MITRETINAQRLLSVVKGDWSPYETRTTYQTVSGGEVGTIETVEYDWGLLRHDVHVLLHHAINPSAQH